MKQLKNFINHRYFRFAIYVINLTLNMAVALFAIVGMVLTYTFYHAYPELGNLTEADQITYAHNILNIVIAGAIFLVPFMLILKYMFGNLRERFFINYEKLAELNN